MTVRELDSYIITEAIARLAIEAAHFLPADVEGAIRDAKRTERSPLAIQIIDEILENAEIARTRMLPLCQDTGTAVVHVELGQDVHITGGYLIDAINDGIRKGYDKGFLRKSITGNPFGSRANTGDNTPGVIHTEVVPGDSVRLLFMPKGGGCENMSRYQNFLPGMGKQAIIDFVCETVDMSSPKTACRRSVHSPIRGIHHNRQPRRWRRRSPTRAGSSRMASPRTATSTSSSASLMWRPAARQSSPFHR